LAMNQQKRTMNPLTVVLILSALFFIIFVTVSGVLFLKRSPGTNTAGTLFGAGAVAVVELKGVIMDSKKVLRRLERYEEDDEVKAVVLRLDSPGGAVAPSQEIYEAVKKYKKPLVVSMGSVAASGAYYIACAAKKIFANPGTITGSIGVIMEFANLEKLYDWAKIKRYSIKTGRFKDAGAEYREMTPEERGLLQDMVDDVLAQFKQAVHVGRKLSVEQVTAVADGRIFSGNQAKTLKLVDELGTLQDAIDEAAEMAKIKGKPEVVYPEKRRKRLLELLLDDSFSDESSDANGRSAVNLLSKILFVLLKGSSLPGLTTLEAEPVGSMPGVYWLWSGVR
jgi:protease IV